MDSILTKMSTEKGITAPKWDGKNNATGRYLSQLEATAEYYDCGGILDPAIAIPTKPVYDTLTDANDANGTRRKLFKNNQRICAMIV